MTVSVGIDYKLDKRLMLMFNVNVNVYKVKLCETLGFTTVSPVN